VVCKRIKEYETNERRRGTCGEQAKRIFCCRGDDMREPQGEKSPRAPVSVHVAGKVIRSHEISLFIMLGFWIIEIHISITKLHLNSSKFVSRSTKFAYLFLSLSTHEDRVASSTYAPSWRTDIIIFYWILPYDR
jgi:hypothetical protein